MLETMMTGPQLLAEALITWTPMTYYVAGGLAHMIVALVGFRVLQVDTENNPFISSLFVAGVSFAAGFFLKDYGLVGLIIGSAALFGIMLATTAGDAIKSLVLAGVCIATYAGLGNFIVPRTPLTPGQIGGFTKAFMEGMDEEAIAGEDDLYEHTEKKTEDSLSE